MTMRFILHLSVLFVFVFAPVLVLAQDQETAPFADSGPADTKAPPHLNTLRDAAIAIDEESYIQDETEGAEEDYSDEEVEGFIQEFVETRDDNYVEPNLENISKLYWAIGKFDIADDKLIDYYLMINECELYMQFYHNDFEWAKIQKATKNHILNNMNEFPTHFEIFSPLPLGRYDQDKEEFELAPETKITGLRRLDFAMNMLGYKEVCTKTGDIYEYPPNIVVILSRPFVLEKIPVKRELAKLYIEEAKSFYDALPPRLQLVNYERLAFLRLKIKITQYKNTVRLVGGDLRAVVFGRLEGFEIYADQDKLKPLYSKNFEDKRFKRLRKRPQAATELQVPQVVDPDDIPDRGKTPVPAPGAAAPAPQGTPASTNAPSEETVERIKQPAAAN